MWRRLRRITCAAAVGGGLLWMGAATVAAAGGTGPGVVPGAVPRGTGLVEGVACLPTGSECWAVGGYPRSAFILFSSDGGLSWHSQSIPAGFEAADSIACADARFCLASVGAPQRANILATTDGGAGWALRPWPETAPPTSISCPAVSRCVAVGEAASGFGAVFRTVDGGRTWSQSPLPAQAGDIRFVTCEDAVRCWATGGSILASTDGGATWSLRYPPQGSQAPGPGAPAISGLAFTTASDGWAVGGQQCGGPNVISCPGDILRTSDGGQTWRLQESLAQGPYLNGISCAAAACYVTGSFAKGAEALSFSGSGAARPIPGTHTTGSIATAVCEPWGCLIAGGTPASGGFILTTKPAAAVVPLRRGTWLTNLIPTFQEVSWKAGDVGRSLVLVLGLLVVVGFPSQIFNSTLMAHYEEVMGWLDRPRRVLHLPAKKSRAAEVEPTPAWQVAGVFVLGGLFGALLNPRAGFDPPTAESLVGILLATAFTTIVYTLVRALAVHRITRQRGHLQVYWGGVGIAAACLVLSRLTAAQPGYLYGVLLGYTLGRTVELERHHEGRLVALSAAAVLLASVSTWLLWTPVKAAAAGSSAFWIQALSTAMAGVFLGGMTSLMFGMLPMKWLDGEKLLSWRRAIWAAVMGVGLFLFVHVVLRNAASAPPSRSLVVSVALFATFGLLSLGGWAYFNFRPDRATEKEETILVGSVALTAEEPAPAPKRRGRM